MNNLKKVDANLVKKYHQDLVFNYAEYPTKDHWDFKFNGQNYKDALLSCLPNNKDKKFSFMFTYHSVKSYVGFVLVVNLSLRTITG